MSRLRANLAYGRYVARHKFFVLIAGLVLHVPLWRLLIHDWSKFSRAEWGPYVRRFFDESNERPGEFDAAWKHHKEHSPHHWQFWLVGNGYELEPTEIPDHFVREMLADWIGAGRAITGSWEVLDWYEKNREKMVLHPATRAVVEAWMYS